MPKQAVSVILTAEERKTLESLASSRTAPYRQVQRARLILLPAEGMTNTAIASEVDLSRGMVVQWRQRFSRDRLTGLIDQPRPGRPWVYTDADRLRVRDYNLDTWLIDEEDCRTGTINYEMPAYDVRVDAFFSGYCSNLTAKEREQLMIAHVQSLSAAFSGGRNTGCMASSARRACNGLETLARQV